MKVIILGKENHQSQPLFQNILLEGATRGHDVQMLDKRSFLRSDLNGIDLVCLKSHYDVDAVWTKIDETGVPAINNQSATLPCLDRRCLHKKLQSLEIPTPKTAVNHDDLMHIQFPVIQKPIDAGDHTLFVHHSSVFHPNFERNIYQEQIPSDGTVLKLYVVGDFCFLVKESGDGSRIEWPLDRKIVEYGKRIQSGFGLTLFGADFIRWQETYVAIDVNPFPGFRGVKRLGQSFWKILERND